MTTTGGRRFDLNVTTQGLGSDRTAGEFMRLHRLAHFRALPWYRRAWLTLTGKAPR